MRQNDDDDDGDDESDGQIVVTLKPGKIFVVFIILCLVFEIGLWTCCKFCDAQNLRHTKICLSRFSLYAYINADEVKCNWIWCEFTDVKTISTSSSIIETNVQSQINIHSICRRNGIEINCSEITG